MKAWAKHMDLFEVIITPYALEQLDSYIGYIQYTLLNPIAADSLWRDSVATADELERCAGSLEPCKHPELRKRGYHPLPFLKHDYVMLYRIAGKTVFVDAIYHLMQDYENTFAELL